MYELQDPKLRIDEWNDSPLVERGAGMGKAAPDQDPGVDRGLCRDPAIGVLVVQSLDDEGTRDVETFSGPAPDRERRGKVLV
jgi:hypothetical protein